MTITADFLGKIENIFPQERIYQSKQELHNLAQNCTGRYHLPLLSIKVINQEEIIQLLSLANEYKTPIYPISIGHNWGYGSGSPYQEGCIQIDLSLMNKILHFNSKTGVLTIEPGVTQLQLYEFLQAQKADFLTPTNGAGPYASILANALEHGFGLTPHADHCLAIMSLEAILPDGSTYRSDFAEKGAVDLDRNFKWSVGPYLDGLFTQSNFGIVTNISITLAHRPSDISAFYFSLKGDQHFEGAVIAIQKIMHRYAGLVCGINLMNDYRVISMLQKSPSTNALTKEELESLKDKLGLTNWTGMGTLYCDKIIARIIQKEIKKILNPHCNKFIFMNQKKVHFFKKILKFVPKKFSTVLLDQLNKINQSLDIFEGKPGAAALPLTYWRSQSNPPLNSLTINPDNEDIGLIWYSPIIVQDCMKTRDLIKMVMRICQKNNIDPLITFSAFDPRVFDATIPILFNRNDDVQKQNAYRCYEELVNSGMELGYVPYRLGIEGHKLVITQNNFWDLQSKIKKMLDPNNIMAPGRYSYESESSQSKPVLLKQSV
jgi:FAD/FMN-containing dehydrogenase